MLLLKRHLIDLVRAGKKRQTIRLWKSRRLRPGQISFTPGLGKMRITAVDTLEHIADDAGALREWGRVLRPDGRLFIFVPAHRWLWSLQDEVSHHKRRYVARTLRAAVVSAGLEVERQTYVSTFLLPVIYVGRQWLKVRRKFREYDTENDLHPAWSNGILRAIFQWEIPILRRTNMPFGASLLCVARKVS